MSTRLNKFISESGVCSRREADRYIEMGQVLINGRKAQIGDQVSNRDKVIVNGLLVEGKKAEDFIFLAFNKPVGITSTTEIGVKDSIIDFIGFHERIFPIGRLDKDSQGLIFLTNDGDIVNKILRAGNRHEKEYLVTVNKPIEDKFIERMGNGVPILGEMTKKCLVVKESPFVFRITLIQGLNRQIRRMCEYFEYEVVKLERVRIMNITLKGLPVGDWRELDEREMKDIYAALETSSSTEEASKGVRVTRQHIEHQQKSISAKKTPPAKKDFSVNPKSKELRGGGAKKEKPTHFHGGNKPRGRAAKR
ncbi:MAG: 23S rRNA pseudouridine(2604) synthase RluF [Bacteroidales bacterium]|nr:23S rRNA pseudouridine(2604) synthase RluF [Bacteroidales bacterium]